MHEDITYRPYADLLKEFRQKVEYLKTLYHLEQRKIAAVIGTHPTNLSRYMDKKNDQPCSLRQLLKITARVDHHYSKELTHWAPADKPSGPYKKDNANESMESPSNALSYKLTEITAMNLKLTAQYVLLQANTEMLLEFIARLEKKPEGQLFEELDRKKTEISKRTDAE